MRRRALLAALGATTTGCSGFPSSSGRETGFRVDDLAVSTTKVAPEKRYVVEVVAVASEAGLADDPAEYTVRALSSVEDPAVRSVLEEVIREDRLRRDDVPDGLPALTERVDYFTWGLENRSADATSHWSVAVHRLHPDRDPVVRFDASVVDAGVAPDDPGVVAFSLTNVGGHPQSVASRGVAPLGVLRAVGAGGSMLLWHDYDEASDCVTIAPDGTAVTSCRTSTTVDSGQSVTAGYDLRHSPPVGDALAAGDYVVADRLLYKRAGEEYGLLPFVRVEWEVGFAVERA